MIIELNENKYKLVKNYRDAFDLDAVVEKATDYFNDYDYIFGDWAYGKVRLKGYYKDNNPKVTKINNINNLDDYIKNNCAYDCKYFLLEKDV